MALYKGARISQAGCLVALLPLLLILPMHQVVNEGLAPPTSPRSLKVFGVQLVPRPAHRRCSPRSPAAR